MGERGVQHSRAGERGIQPARGVGRLAAPRRGPRREGSAGGMMRLGSPRRAQISQLELFEFILLLKLGKLFPVEPFEPTASQSMVPSPTLKGALQQKKRTNQNKVQKRK